MSEAKAARWLDLIALLLSRRFPVTREEIFQSVEAYREPWERAEDESASETVRRKFERDKDDLRSLGIAIESVSIPQPAQDDPNIAYRLRPSGFYLPYLELTDDTATANYPYPGLARLSVSADDLALLDRATRRVAARTEFPLAAAARSVRRKLEFDLPVPERAIERILAEPIDSETQRSLERLQGAVAARRAVRCWYYSIGRDAEEQREVEPYGLFFTWGRWYAVGRDRNRDVLRVFRIDRMRDVQPVPGKESAFEVPRDFTVVDYLGRAPWELSDNEPTTVQVRFAFPESRWVQARGVGIAVTPLLEDGGALLEFAVRDLQPFLRWLLTFRRRIQVVKPKRVGKELDRLRRRVAAVYGKRDPS